MNASTRDTFSSSSPGSTRESLVTSGSHAITFEPAVASAAHVGSAPGLRLGSDVGTASKRQQHQPGSFSHWDSTNGAQVPTNPEDVREQLSAQSSRRRTLQDFLHRLTMSKRDRQTSGKSSTAAAGTESGTAKDLIPAQSGFSAVSAGSMNEGVLGTSGRRLAQLFSWNGWSRGSKTYQVQPLPSTLKPQLQQQQAAKQKDRTLRRQDDLLQMAMVSQQAQCVRLVVDALLEGQFSKMSVVLHMYDALQALIHDAQVGGDFGQVHALYAC
eukprot:GHUV01032437.1.p1 GENE.GHUV01032437.1~~GHUV01032437.1.p1  ORF type:complete len:287 (+),score=71.91 GHUV01032437.1:54-863(+)